MRSTDQLKYYLTYFEKQAEEAADSASSAADTKKSSTGAKDTKDGGGWTSYLSSLGDYIPEGALLPTGLIGGGALAGGLLGRAMSGSEPGYDYDPELETREEYLRRKSRRGMYGGALAGAGVGTLGYLLSQYLGGTAVAPTAPSDKTSAPATAPGGANTNP